MGGMVATLAAEGQFGPAGLADGYVAIGAALLHEQKSHGGRPVPLTARPTAPRTCRRCTC